MQILYALGVYSVFRAAGVDMKRFAGASSGSMLATELALLGLDRVVTLYLAYGTLQDESPSSLAYAAWRADRHWLDLSHHLFQGNAHEAIKSKIFVSVTRLTWKGTVNKIYSDYISEDQARRAYYATGTGLTILDGYMCTDGGVTNATPIFQDHRRRPQIIIRPPPADNNGPGLPTDMVVRFSFNTAYRAIEMGQDDARRFLLRCAGADDLTPGARVVVGGIELLSPINHGPNHQGSETP